MLKRLLLALAVAMPVSSGAIGLSSASAQTVPANQTTELAAVYIYQRRTCRIAPTPTVTILRQPENGEVVVRDERRQLDAPCDNRTARAAVIYFTPDRGFRGSDSFTYRLRYPRSERGGQRTRTNTVRLVVQ